MIYAHPKGELLEAGIALRSQRVASKRRKPLGERTGGRIAGTACIDDRPTRSPMTVESSAL